MFGDTPTGILNATLRRVPSRTHKGTLRGIPCRIPIPDIQVEPLEKFSLKIL